MIRRALRTIAHRLALALLALLAFAPPAGAVEVARIEGASLDVREERDADFCMELTARNRRGGGGSGSCGPAPWRERRSSFVTVVHDDRLVVGGAVPAAIARAEAELADGQRVAFDTVPGPGYRGRYAGQLRFFLAELPLADPSDDEQGGLVALRFLDAAGTLRGAAASDRNGRRIGRAQRLLRERRRGASISVVATVQRRLAPTPLQLDRFEDQTCIVLRRRARFSGGESTLCRERGPNRPALALTPEHGCGPLRTVLAGFVGDTVTAVRLRLGSGRVREVPARTLPGGEHRYVATAIPRGEAVRRVTAVGADAGYDLGQPPSGQPCAGDAAELGVYAFDFGEDGPAAPPHPDDQVVAEAGGHRLLARDAEAERLCTGVDRLLADGADCRLPPVTTDEALGFWRSGVISAVLPADVARIRLPGGREVPTVAYGGRYGTAVRFLLAEAGGEATERVRMLDSAGRVIGRLLVSGRVEPSATPVRLAAGRGWQLAASRFGRVTCIALAAGGEQPDCDTPVGDDSAFAEVSCRPRVAVVYGALDRRTRSVRVVLRGGRTLRARIVRIPRRAGGGRAFVLALPRRAQVRALRLDRRRIAFPVVPAARQCGYSVAAPFVGVRVEPR